MNRDWMYVENRTQPEFLNGIEEFCRTAIEHQRTTKGETIFCPCRDCNNVKKWKEISVVENHLFRRGFMANYTIWYWHGEKIIPTTSRSSINDADMENREQYDDNERDTDDFFEEDHIPEMMDGLGDHVNEESRMFENVSKAAETPLYPGCAKYSKLSGVLTLFNLKAKNGWTDTSFNSLLEALSDMLPEGNDIPKSTYYAKKLLCPLGLEYTKIDACPNDCVLFRNEYENLDACPKCGVDRYKREGSNPNRKKWPPAKVLWYLPIIPRFKRLFSIKKDAKNLVWHAQERKKDGYIRHPADSKQWKHIDDTFPEFGKEARNLRLALSTDGMNPYGTLSSQHSTWPVLLSIYNLPPWLCMKRKYIMLSLLISGPKQPGNDIDVYLEPLLEDLRLLWDKGVPMFDAHTSTNFTLRTMIFCTVSDFPAYGNLSWYKVRGKKPCPIREDKMEPTRLKNFGKDVYMHTRRLLRRDHPYRKKKAEFNGFPEKQWLREPLSGIELWERIKDVETIFWKVGKPTSITGLWKKVSTFWTLPYWIHLSVRHCLDVMHIEKNVCDSIIGTLLNIPNKKGY
ncbi:uncharacterized protein LOC110686603 [Chenopodium quinoa]|uniref:uncharacterized protein LOC110686603 n=1 Tax=Chenopodium quinoa TaxID=63459 RepID=UPI000B779C4B|nr:uncharacterized protein LOC110686603 [Chenopodium quinoa]